MIYKNNIIHMWKQNYPHWCGNETNKQIKINKTVEYNCIQTIV